MRVKVPKFPEILSNTHQAYQLHTTLAAHGNHLLPDSDEFAILWYGVEYGGANEAEGTEPTLRALYDAHKLSYHKHYRFDLVPCANAGIFIYSEDFM